MILKQLKIRNVGVHADLDVEFPVGIIGVLGPNGSGKSTLLNAAHAAITNDFSRFVGGKEGAVRQNAEGPAEVSLTISHNGVEATITRGLSPKTFHDLEIEGRSPIQKAGEIEEALQDFLGVDKHTLSTHVFVPQWELRSLFEATPGERSKLFSRLCGTTMVEPALSAVRRQSDVDTALLSGRFQDLGVFREELQRCRDERAAAERAKAEAEASALSAAEVAAIARDVEKARNAPTDDLAQNLDLRTRLRKEVADLEEQEPRLAPAKERAATELATLREELVELSAAVKSASEARNYRAVYDRLVQDRADAEREWNKSLKKLAAAEENADNDDTVDVEEREQRIRSLRSEEDGLKKLLDAFSGLSEKDRVCPTCHQSLDEVLKDRDETQRKLSAVSEELDTASRFLRRVKSARQNRDKASAAVEETALAHSRAEAKLAEFGEVPSPPANDPSEAYDNKKAAVTAAEGRVSAIDEDIAEHVESLRHARYQLSRVEERVQELTREVNEAVEVLGDETLLALENRLKEQQAARELVGERTSDYNAAVRAVAAAEKRFGEARSVRRREKKTRQWLAVLDRVSAVLHRDRLPAKVHRAMQHSLLREINHTLEEFDSPYMVSPDDDLSYTADFLDGTRVSAAGLSGGQSVLLALAFRQALNKTFDDQLGLLVLDEPTAGLDHDNLAMLEELLANLGRTLTGSGRQMFVITHEASTSRVFDKVVSLERPIR